MCTIIRNKRSLTCFFWLFFTLFWLGSVVGQITVENVGGFGGWPDCVVAQGNYAFLAQGSRMFVFDVTGGQMQRVGFVILDEEPNNMVLHGNYIYAFASWSDTGLQIVDISNPLEPTLAGTMSLETQRTARGFVADNHAYVAMEDRITIIDVTDKAALQVVNTTTTSAEEIFVSGQYGYVGHDQGLTVFNVTDPANPEEVGSYTSDRVRGLQVIGNYAYIGYDTFPNVGLSIVDVSDPQNLSPKGFVETKIVQGNQSWMKNPVRISVEGNHAYIGCLGSAYLYIADITDPENPFLTGYLDIIDSDAWIQITSVHAVSPYVFVTLGGTEPGFFIIDVSDKANPSVASSLDEPWESRYLFTCRDTLYLSALQKLWVYRFPDPADPTPVLLGSDTTWADLRRIFVQGKRLYGIKEDDLYIVDVTNPANMTELGTYESTVDWFRELHVLGDYAYLISGLIGPGVLEVVNISDPANPFKEGDYALLGEGRDLFVAEGSTLAYVAYYADDSNQGFQILDVSTPSSITPLGTGPTTGKPTCIGVEKNLVCVGSNVLGVDQNTWYLEAFNVQDKTAPLKMTEETGTGTIVDVKIKDDLIVASIPENSLFFFLGMAMWAGNISSFEEFEAFMFTLYLTCPSPLSGYIEYLFYEAWEEEFWVSIDGYTCLDLLEFYASYGLFLQFCVYMSDVESDEGDFHLPTRFSLSQNYPNPFNPSTTIHFNVKEKCDVSLQVYDVYGREVATIARGEYLPGHYEATFTTNGLAAGVYFYRIQAGDFHAQRKMVLVK